MTQFFQKTCGYGIVGLTDPANTGTVTLSLSGRRRIELFGSYWPRLLKNWWSDDWAQHVYETAEGSLFYKSAKKMQNTQTYGQRYHACSHLELYHQLLASDQARISLPLVRKLKDLPNCSHFKL